jgi:uncharacterized protein (DUF302 family)
VVPDLCVVLARLVAKNGHERQKSMYGFSIKLKPGFDKAIEQVTAALKTEGFGVLSDIDVQATLKAKLGQQMPSYRILGACNPAFAHRALSADPDIGLLLPCNVIVRQEGDASITVGFMDPEAVMQLVDKPGVAQMASEVRVMLNRVRDKLLLSA